MNLEDMQLPGTSPNEDLETLSRQEFKRLFDISLFEIRDEEFRDKGIDCTIEVKFHGKYTNYRTNVQLKSTNKDDDPAEKGITYQLDTSNINYLLNGGVAAYYVVYVKPRNCFYYREAADIFSTISDRNENWNSQKSHTIRFTEKLTPEGMMRIYDHCIAQGKMQRQVAEQLMMRTAMAQDAIIIDAANNVSSDGQIRSELEATGFQLINEAKWLDIIELHKKGSGNIASSARYNLILGIAYFYSSQRFDALSAFKAALASKAELPTEQQGLLLFFELTARHSIGMIDDSTFRERSLKLEEDKYIGAYVRIDEAKRRLHENLVQDSKAALSQYFKDLGSIIDDQEVNENVKMIAEAELLYYAGDAINTEYMKSVTFLNNMEEIAGPDMAARRKVSTAIAAGHQQWMKDIEQLKEKARVYGNSFAYFLVWSYQVKIMYEFVVYLNAVKVGIAYGIDLGEIPLTQRQLAGRLLPDLDTIINYYTKVQHYQNVCYALSIRYEVLHYLGQFKEAAEVLDRLESIIETYDLKEQVKGLNALKNEGPTHLRFKKFFTNIVDQIAVSELEMKQLSEEMGEMDHQDSAKPFLTDSYTINCFPMGDFQVPKKKLAAFFQIINVLAEDVRQQFRSMLDDEIIPVANILYDEVVQEGPREGFLADRGVESKQSMYRIRQALYEAGMRRL